MLNLYILRHGETDYNAQKIVQGSGIDAPLNNTGRHQAAQFYKRYRFTRFEKTLYCSTLQRTAQTVEPFREDGYAIEALSELREFHWGEYEGRVFDNSAKAELQTITQAWENGDLSRRIPGGDSPLEAQQRIHQALTQIRSKHTTGNVLICTHGRLMRIMLSSLLRSDIRQMNDYRHQNTGLNVIQLAGNGTAEVMLLNDTSHLQ
jgi:probable phosphoglycerate mutase